MPIIYRTPGAWGAGKGANLTPAEVDGNFYQLVLDILAATSDLETPVGISNIIVAGTQMTVVLDDATELGPFDLPQAPFRPTVTQTVSGTTHSPAVEDANGYLRCTNVSGCLVTVPANADVEIPIDTEISYRQCQGAGQVSFVGDTGVTINGIEGYDNATALEGAVITLKKVAANEWDIFGLLAETIS